MLWGGRGTIGSALQLPVMNVLPLSNNACNSTKHSRRGKEENGHNIPNHLQDTLSGPAEWVGCSPECDSPGQGVVAVHDGVDPAYELVHADDLLQVLLRQLQYLQDVQPEEIIPI